MMPSNGPPTLKGVGGPTPPLVSKGSEVELHQEYSQEGPFPWMEGGTQRLPLGRGEAPAPTMARGGLIQNRQSDEEPPPTQRGREVLILTQGGVHDPPPTREGRE